MILAMMQNRHNLMHKPLIQRKQMAQKKPPEGGSLETLRVRPLA
jgi:hypothetical protein